MYIRIIKTYIVTIGILGVIINLYDYYFNYNRSMLNIYSFAL